VGGRRCCAWGRKPLSFLSVRSLYCTFFS
jgi:hypothetical protein